MAKTKQWTVQTNAGMRTVSYIYGLKGGIEVDGQNRMPIKQFPNKRTKFMGMLQEFPFTLDDRNLMVVLSGNSLRLVADGVFVDTGEPYVTLDKLPAWTYIFLVLNAALFLFLGAIPAVCAVLGVTFTMQVAMKPYMSTGMKILACIGILLGMLAIIFGVSFLLLLIFPY